MPYRTPPYTSSLSPYVVGRGEERPLFDTMVDLSYGMEEAREVGRRQ